MAEPILDIIDAIILRELERRKRIPVNDLRIISGLSHSNLLEHLERLAPFVDRIVENRKVFFSLNEGGLKAIKLLNEITKLGEEYAQRVKEGQEVQSIQEKIKEKIKEIGENKG